MEHEGNPLGWIRWVDRYVGAPALRTARSPTTIASTARAKANQNLGADPHAAKSSGQAVRPSVQLEVSERPAGASHGDRFRDPCRLQLDQTMDQARSTPLEVRLFTEQSRGQPALLTQRQLDTFFEMTHRFLPHASTQATYQGVEFVLGEPIDIRLVQIGYALGGR